MRCDHLSVVKAAVVTGTLVDINDNCCTRLCDDTPTELNPTPTGICGQCDLDKGICVNIRVRGHDDPIAPGVKASKTETFYLTGVKGAFGKPAAKKVDD
jgi:hypothetical protein